MNKCEELIEFVKSKDSVTLKEIYAAFPDWNKDGLRGFINLSVKKGKHFIRVSKSTYAKIQKVEE